MIVAFGDLPLKSFGKVSPPRFEERGGLPRCWLAEDCALLKKKGGNISQMLFLRGKKKIMG